MKKKKVGVLGGTFNPVHNGHIQCALTVLGSGLVDEVMLMPSNDPPHKGSSVIKPEHRLSMLNLALKDQNIAVSELELKRSGITYTFDTLTELGEQNLYYFIIGTDSFNNLYQWYRADELLNKANFIVVNRAGEVNKDLKEKVELFNYQYRGDFKYCEMDAIDISSSKIRACIKAGKSVKGLIPDDVADYIEKWKLYK